MQNHYFDKDGLYVGSAAAGNEEIPPRDAIREMPLLDEGSWPRLNAARDGWDLVEDHFGVDAWLDGEARRIDYHGQLRAGWSLEEPPPPPDTRTPEEIERDEAAAERRREVGELNDALPDIVAAQTLLVQRQVNGVTAKLTDAEVTVLATGIPKAFRVWAAGEAYAAGEWMWFPESGAVLYEVKQAVAKALEHQTPASAGMLAVYRPVDPATGTVDDPKTFVLGMDARAGLYYLYSGGTWKCLRDLIPTFEGRQPGAAGMETFWQKVG